MGRRFVAGTIGLLAALWLAPSASADTATIGSVAPTSIGGCTSCTFMQYTTDPSSPSYVVPPAPTTGPWTVTSWSARGGNFEGSGALEIWRPTAVANQFQLVTIGPEQPFPANAVTPHPVSIPVLPGDHLGVLTGNDSNFAPNYTSGPAADVTYGAIGFPTTGQTLGPSGSDFVANQIATRRVNAEATLTAPSAPAPITPIIKKKKCKKKKKRLAESAKKKKCKKRKK